MILPVEGTIVHVKTPYGKGVIFVSFVYMALFLHGKVDRC